MIKVNSIKEAWQEADRLIPNDYMQDMQASKRAGYPIYRSTVEFYDYICDLGDRLEINLANGQTINIWIDEQSSATIDEYADNEASTITIRKYENGCSKDITRPSTKEEKKMLKSLIVGALKSIKDEGKDKQTAMDVAEYIAVHLFDEKPEGRCNTYLSVYNKIAKCPDYLLNK